MAQQDVDVSGIEEGMTVELRYEKNGVIPSHHDRVREQIVTVTQKDRTTVKFEDDTTEYQLYADGEVHIDGIDTNFRHAVKAGELLEVTPT